MRNRLAIIFRYFFNTLVTAKTSGEKISNCLRLEQPSQPTQLN